MPRTQNEIVARLHKIQAAGCDMFGFATEVLAAYLDKEHIAEFVKPETDLSEWVPEPLDQAGEAGAEYLDFAFGKAEDHRGISAGRSIIKLAEFAWLQGRDDVVAAMDDTPYPNYGVPQLMVYARMFELPVPNSPTLARMGQGKRCVPHCDSGCGN